MRERVCTHARLERAAVRALTRARSHGLQQRLFKERAREWGEEREVGGERRQAALYYSVRHAGLESPVLGRAGRAVNSREPMSSLAAGTEERTRLSLNARVARLARYARVDEE